MSLQHPKQAGSAVISALLLAALVATIGGAILFSQQTWLAQMEHQNDRLAARELAHIGIHWARAILFDDGQRSRADHPGEVWAQNMQPIEMEGSIISGHIEDAQGRFDINSLVLNGKRKPESIAAYARLLAILGLPAELAEALADWEDADDETGEAGGAENYFYLALPDPYRAANGPLVAIEELASVRGYNAQIIKRLRPYIVALPERAYVNVNTASPEVLAAVSGMSLIEAQQFAAARTSKPLTTTTALAARFPAAFATNSNLLTVSSRYFLISGTVTKNVTKVRLEVLVKRLDTSWPAVVWIRQG